MLVRTNGKSRQIDARAVKSASRLFDLMRKSERDQDASVKGAVRADVRDAIQAQNSRSAGFQRLCVRATTCQSGKKISRFPCIEAEVCPRILS